MAKHYMHIKPYTEWPKINGNATQSVHHTFHILVNSW